MTRSSNLEALCRLLVSSCIFNSISVCCFRRRSHQFFRVLVSLSASSTTEAVSWSAERSWRTTCSYMKMQLEWWCTWKSTWNPATWLCRWKWDSSGLVLDLTGMIIHSFEGNQWKSYQQNSDSQNRKPQAFKILPNKMPQSKPVVLTLQTEKRLLLLERGVAFLLLLQAPQAFQQPRKRNAIFVGLWTSVAAIQWNSFENL